MAEPVQSREAEYGERMIEVKVRFGQTRLLKGKDKSRQNTPGLRV